MSLTIRIEIWAYGAPVAHQAPFCLCAIMVNRSLTGGASLKALVAMRRLRQACP
jgi:hypothetical protein